MLLSSELSEVSHIQALITAVSQTSSTDPRPPSQIDARAAKATATMTGATPLVSIRPYWPLTVITGRKVGWSATHTDRAT